jgi:formamidopyrimidine-DNA glycosylase
MQANGELGVFQNRFAVYDRLDVPCPACGRPIVKLVQAQRATYMCTRCQR